MKRVFTLIGCLLFISQVSYSQSYEALVDSANAYVGLNSERTHFFLEKAIAIQLSDTTEVPVEKLAYVEILIRNFKNPTTLKSGFWLRAAENLKQYNNNAYLAYAFLSAADRFRVKDSLDHAIRYVDTALFYANQLDYGYYQGVSHALKGLIYVAQANYYEARKSFKANLKLTKTDPPIQVYIRSLIELSNLFAIPEQIDSAIYYLNESIRMSDQINYRRYQARARVDLAKLYLKINQCDSALLFIKQAQPYAYKGDTMEILRFNVAAATINLDCKDVDAAVKLIDTSLLINSTTLKDYKLLAPISLKAAYLIDVGKKEEGFAMYTLALKMLQKSGRKNATIKNALNLLQKIKEEDPTIEENKLFNQYEEILKSFENKDDYSLIKEDSLQFMELKAWYQYKTSQEAEAYQTLYKLYQTQKENYNQELVNKRLQIEGIYQLNDQKVKLENEKKVSNQLKAEAERKNLVIWFISICSLLLVIILIILTQVFKQRREKLKLEEEVNRKRISLAEAEIGNLSKEIAQNKKELTAYTLEVIDKNNLLRSISIKLKQARIDQDFSNIERELNLGLKEKKDWEEFKKRFEKVEAEFLEKLKQNYPELTSGQIRLASLIKLGFSSKQIAEFLNHTPASVDVARSKLRKRLNIPADLDLFEFLSKF